VLCILVLDTVKHQNAKFVFIILNLVTYLKRRRLRADLRLFCRQFVLFFFLGCTALLAQDYYLEIDFPEDAGAACGDLCIPSISYTDEGCAMLLVNRDTARFNASSDECYKLAITFDLIDWCLWDGEYAGALIRRRTEDEDDPLAIDRAVDRSERPVLRLQGPNVANLTLTLDRRHNDQRNSTCGNTDDGSRLPDNDTNYPTNDNDSYRGDLYAGRWRYTQFVKVYDNLPPVVDVPAYGGPTDACPHLTTRQFGDVFGSCETEVSLTFSATDACDLLDDSADDVVILSAELDEYALDANGDGQIDANEFNSERDASGFITTLATGDYRFAGTFPLMQPDQLDQYHTLRVQLGDGCGNQTSVYLPFQVVDCKGPAPSCINGLTVTLHQRPEPDDVDNDGMTDFCINLVYASHFEASPVYDCTGQGPESNAENADLLQVYKYAIYTEEQANQTGFVPQPGQDSLFVTENMDETTFVRVYAFDEVGNYDYCSIYIQVESYYECEPYLGGNLSGFVGTENEVAIEGVQVALSGGLFDYQETTVEGTYLLGDLVIGSDYTITPSLNEDIDNGVTTFDIVLINKHILGTDTLESPYAMIAADVNHSESITIRDIIQMRRVILGIDTAFVNNTSWRFVPENYEFPDPLNPWTEEFPEVGNVNDLIGTEEVNFVGIKVGDVNNSVRANSQQE